MSEQLTEQDIKARFPHFDLLNINEVHYSTDGQDYNLTELGERIDQRLQAEKNAPDFDLIIPDNINLNEQDELRLTDMYDYVQPEKDVTVFNSYVYTLDVHKPFKPIEDKNRDKSLYYTACCLFKLNGIEQRYNIGLWLLDNYKCVTPFSLIDLGTVLERAANKFESINYRYTKRKMIFGKFSLMNGAEKQMYSGEIMGKVKKDKKLELIKPYLKPDMTQIEFHNTLVQAGIKIGIRTVKRYYRKDRDGVLTLGTPPKTVKRFLKAA